MRRALSLRRYARIAFIAAAIASQLGTVAPALAQSVQSPFGTPRPAETEAARTERCDRYARRQVESRNPGAVGGMARGAVGGAILGAIIDGGDGAAGGAAVGATQGLIGGAPSPEYERAYQTFFGACMRAP